MSFFGNTAAQAPATQKKVANISSDQINSNQQSVPVKYLAGRNYVAGDYISPAYNPKAVPITTQAGKGNTETTGYKYFADFALVFCTGGRRPVDGLYTVIVDSDIVWSGNVTRGNAHREIITVPNYGLIYLYWGDETQGVDSILLSPRSTPIGGGNQLDSTTWPANVATGNQHTFSGLASGDANPYSGHYDIHPAYRGQCYGVFKNWKLGRDRTSVPNIQLELKRGCPWLNGASVAADDLGVNPIAILFDWLTDARFGMGLPETSLDATTFQSTYSQVEAIGGRLSPLISQQSEFREAVAKLLEYFDGWIRRKGKLIQVGLWTHGTPVSAATLTDDDLLGDPELEPQGWGTTLNEITVVYKDREHHYNDYTQIYRDPNNFRVTGAPRADTYQREWLTDADLAKQYAQSFGAVAALPYTSGALHVKREFLSTHSLLAGQIITYSSAFYGLSFLLRIQQIDFPADKDASATLTVEWERAKWPSLYIPPGFQGPGGFVLGPRAIWRSRITEIPYLLLDQKFATQVVALAVKGNREVVGFRVWVSFDSGATYQDLKNSNHFCYFGRVQAVFAANAGTAHVYLYGVGLDDVVTQTPAQQQDDTLLMFCEGEIMSVGNVGPAGSGLFNIGMLRHRLGTIAAQHAVNSDVFFIFRSQMRPIDNAQFYAGQTILVKLQPFTHEQDYDIGSISPSTYTIVGWSIPTAPVLSPPGEPFFPNVVVHATAQAGMTIRYTTDGSQVNSQAPVFPAANGKRLTTTTTIRVRAFNPNGLISPERIATYTKLTAPPTQQICSPPLPDFSGVQGYSAGNLTLIPTTTGSTSKYKKNGGPETTYSSAIALVCTFTGDVVEFWATLAGYDDSPHSTFDNTREEPHGGGSRPPNPP